MRAPSKQQTMDYFRSMGYEISQSECSMGAGAWNLSGEGLPLDRRTFPTRLRLWITWMECAADAIHDSFLGDALKEIWEGSGESERAAFAEEVRAWRNGHISPRLESLLSNAPAKTADNLPRDWQKRMREIMHTNSESYPCWLIIAKITEHHGGAELEGS